MAKINTTLKIEENIMKASKAMALKDGITLQEVINIALAEYTLINKKRPSMNKKSKKYSSQLEYLKNIAKNTKATSKVRDLSINDDYLYLLP